jgi:ABC-2 type transport system ATP-binding protein
MRELLRGDVRRTEVTIAKVSEPLEGALKTDGFGVRRVADHVHVELEGDEKLPALLRQVLDAGAHVIEVVPRRETLEDLFVRRAIPAGD